MFRYEHHSHPVLPRAGFLRRIAAHGGLAIAITAASLLAGAAGYHYTEGMSWLDGVLNASMILTGMGPVTVLQTPAGKIFATCFALYSGLVFLVVTALLIAPFVHRLLHSLQTSHRGP